MRARTGLIVATLAGVGALALLLSRPRPADEAPPSEPAAASEASPPAVAEPAREPAVAAAPVKPAPAGSEAARRAESYFHSQILGKRAAIDRLYDQVRAAFPAGDASELVAVYVAESIGRNGSREFAEFMTDLHQGLRDRSQELYDLLQAQEPALRDQDPFIYLMTLNMAARLALPGEQRALLLGDAMNIHFTPDPEKGLTPASANITNALILMKNYGITAEQAAPYIQQGVTTNQDNPQALAEFVARANTYYPGSVPGH